MSAVGRAESTPVEPDQVMLAKGCHGVDAAALTDARAALTGAVPLVHCLTNTVVQTLTANALLAVGAAPAMVEEPQEAEGFAAVASAVLVNLGTVHERTATAMRVVARAASAPSREAIR